MNSHQEENGDLPYSVADNLEAKIKLNWEPSRNLETMCIDSWNWYKNNLKVELTFNSYEIPSPILHKLSPDSIIFLGSIIDLASKIQAGFLIFFAILFQLI